MYLQFDRVRHGLECLVVPSCLILSTKLTKPPKEKVFQGGKFEQSGDNID